MDRRVVLAIIAVGLMFSGCPRNSEPSQQTGAAQPKGALPAMLQGMDKGPEAKQWLQTSGHPAALASNRFESTQAALLFVDSLYTAGAMKVIVPEKAIRPNDVGPHPYADSLFVTLPEDSAKKKAVLAICEREAKAQGMELGPELRQGVVFLWWD